MSEDWKSKPDSYWKEKLTPEQYRVCRKNGTEPARSGKYDKFYEAGVYVCSSCGSPLFKSETKFDSGTGWPSFYDVSPKENVLEKPDNRFFMKRTEVKCNVCDAHLGHVFKDGPQPTGLRYCINSVCLDFQPKK